MDTRTRGSAKNLRYRYSRPCGDHSSYNYGPYSYTEWAESVESYRGKPTYINVGSKRRKAFHPFTRYKYRNYHSEPSHWCEGTAMENIACDQHYAWWNYLAWLATYSYSDLDTCPYIKGDHPQLIVQSHMQEFGEDLRQFVERDLFAKANSPRFEGAVFLAELDETLVGIKKLLVGAVGSLWKAETAWKHTKHFALNAEELWLWFRYMLMPTMMEVEDMIAAIKPQDIIDRVQDGDRIEETIISGTCHYGKLWNKYWTPCNWTTKYTAGFGGAMDLTGRHDHFEFGTSPWDLVRASWERIPFSFVFDWFVNVGDWLASLRKLEVVYAQSYATFAINANTKLDWTEWNSAKVEVDTLLINRIINLEPPTLPLVDKRWQNCLRTIDLISLSIGMLKGVLRKRR